MKVPGWDSLGELALQIGVMLCLRFPNWERGLTIPACLMAGRRSAQGGRRAGPAAGKQIGGVQAGIVQTVGWD